MILFVDKDTTLFRSLSIRYRGWLYFVGAMGDWSRLMAPALPSIALMGAQLFSQFRFVGKFL